MKKINEKWIPVSEWEDKYEVSDTGNVRHIGSKDNLRPALRNGYSLVAFSNYHNNHSSKSVHRIVLMSFHPCDNMKKLTVNHKDGNKLNNRLDNLEWCTILENNQHARRTGLCNQDGEKSSRSKITNIQAKEIRQMRKTGKTLNEIGKIFGLCKSSTSYIVNYKTFKNV
jgi:hypothetical protein